MPGIQIIGAGNNVSAKVGEEGRLKTRAVAVESEQHANWHHELAFNLLTTVTPSPSATMVYVKNTSDNPMIIEDLTVHSDTAEERVCIFSNVTGTPTGGTAIVPSNSNFGSNKQAEGTFQVGEDLGGLTGGTRYDTRYVSAGETILYNFRNWIILPKNTVVTLCCQNGGSELTISMPFFYVPGEL